LHGYGIAKVIPLRPAVRVEHVSAVLTPLAVRINLRDSEGARYDRTQQAG
jgi:hypothetical protein